jgi:multicomponent Na+:H+ antiporter subunit D
LNPILVAGHEKLLRSVFVVAFFGFGVKAALMPLSFWLPTASVAPTPVTALLHAVAVVKAGAFACIRLIYYGFGTELLKNTPAQQIVISAAAFTIVAGSVLALRENHMKRRLAWSTVSNLSYILLAAAMMSGAGLIAGCKHMIAHAFIKITLFFCVGAVMEKTGYSHIDEIEGLGKRMPVTFACFALASAALIGLPPLPGFYSKWAIGLSAMEQGGVVGYLGMAALMISALLTALYTMGILVPAVFPLKRNGMQPGAVCESATMNGVLIFLCCAIVAIGALQGPLNELLIHLLEGGVY